MQHLFPQNALSKNRPISLFLFFDEVLRIINSYQEIDLQNIDHEWRKLIITEIDPSRKEKYVEEFWVYLYKWKLRKNINLKM